MITWGEASGLRGSMVRTTLATGRDGSDPSDGGVRKHRETTGGHFMSHTAFSALFVSTWPPLLLVVVAVWRWQLPCPSMASQLQKTEKRVNLVADAEISKVTKDGFNSGHPKFMHLYIEDQTCSPGTDRGHGDPSPKANKVATSLHLHWLAMQVSDLHCWSLNYFFLFNCSNLLRRKIMTER